MLMLKKTSLLLLLLLLSSNYNASAKEDMPNDESTPEGYSNDLFHCLEAIAQQDDDTVVCDPTTYGWDLSKLDPESPPDRCDDYTPDITDLLDNNNNDNDDWSEPCLWWHLTFGDLKKSNAPSMVPSLAPSSVPSSECTVIVLC